MFTNELLVFYCVALPPTDLPGNKNTNNSTRQNYRRVKRLSIPPLGYIAGGGYGIPLRIYGIKKTALLPFEKV
jgi:hypothetical protein